MTFPETLGMLGDDMPLPFSKRQGKFIYKKVRASVHARFGVTVNLLEATDSLKSSRLKAILEANE